MRRFRTSLLFPTLLWGGLLTATATAADLLDLPFQDLLQVEIRSAGKREEPIRDIPASVTIVTREEIARYGWQTFEELLRHVPGFYLLTNTEDRFIGTRGTVGGGVQVACARGRLNHCYAVHNNSYSPDSSRTPTWPSIHRDAERSRTAVAIARRQSSTRSFSGIWRPTLPWQGKMTGTASGCRPTSNGRFGVISNAASSPTGRLSQTKYHLSTVPFQITVIRRHHPLCGQRLDVLSDGKACVVVQLADGSSMKLPRCWTDADGASHCEELQGDAQLCLIGLRELLKLVEALSRRAVPADDTYDEIAPPHDNEGDSNTRTAVARSHASSDRS